MNIQKIKEEYGLKDMIQFAEEIFEKDEDKATEKYWARVKELQEKYPDYEMESMLIPHPEKLFKFEGDKKPDYVFAFGLYKG